MVDPTQQVADALLDGVAHLRAGRPVEALGRLTEVVRDPAFARAPELGDVRARAWSLRAQAAFQAGRLPEAESAAEEALRQARTVGDSEGIADVTSLLATIRDRRAKADGPDAALAERLRATSLSELLALRDPVARAEALLRKCRASLDDGDRATVLAAAELAWREASSVGNTRVQVLARLCAAHADPAGATDHVAAALRVADVDGDVQTLVTAVARTAELLGVALPVQVGPVRGEPVEVGAAPRPAAGGLRR